MPAKGRALPGSCWWGGGKEGCDTPPPALSEPRQVEIRWEWGHGAPMALPHCCLPPAKDQQLAGHPGLSPIFAVGASREHRHSDTGGGGGG